MKKKEYIYQEAIQHIFNLFYISEGCSTPPLLFSHIYDFKQSLYQSACMSVSESVCVCLFPNSYETANPNELKF